METIYPFIERCIFAWNQKFKKEIIFRKNAEDKEREQKNSIEDKNKIHQSEKLMPQNEEITAQYDQIEKQRTAITDSIFYAWRIQTGFCHARNTLSKYCLTALFYLSQEILYAEILLGKANR